MPLKTLKGNPLAKKGIGRKEGGHMRTERDEFGDGMACGTSVPWKVIIWRTGSCPSGGMGGDRLKQPFVGLVYLFPPGLVSLFLPACLGPVCP